MMTSLTLLICSCFFPRTGCQGARPHIGLKGEPPLEDSPVRSKMEKRSVVTAAPRWFWRRLQVTLSCAHQWAPVVLFPATPDDFWAPQITTNNHE